MKSASQSRSCCRVTGPWSTGSIQQVKAGLNLTVVLSSEGKVYQMGETGAGGRAKWEGCHYPELVRGPDWHSTCCNLHCPRHAIACYFLMLVGGSKAA